MHRSSVAFAAVAIFGLACVARADDGAWLKDRQARFAAFQAVRPHPDSANAQPVELWDGAEFPEMIVVPAGEYAMGSPADEANRDPREDPRHRVRIGYSFAVGKYPITVGEFAHFVAATGYDAGDWCHTDEAGAQPKTGRNWRTPGFDQTDANPVVCVSALDAQAYIDWLSRTTGHHYRLMSEAEYEYVNRAGTVSAFWWGDDANAACAYANGPDLDTQAVFPSWAANACHDGYAFTAPVGRFKANAFGLYDTTGNAWSWLADCYTDSYVGAPTDGSANLGGDCKWHMLRGGAWGRAASYLRSARRGRDLVGNRIYNNSFRVARTL